MNMKKIQLFSLSLSCFLLGLFIVVLFCVRIFAEEHTSHISRYFFPTIVILAFINLIIYFVSRKKHKASRDSLNSLTFLTYILLIYAVATTLICWYEKQELPDWHRAISYLAMAMTMTCEVFKYQQKRIDALEEKLNNQNQPKE